MGQFEDAAKRALEMAETQSFIIEYFKSRGQVWPSDPAEQTAALARATAECAKELLTRVTEGISQYLRDSGSDVSAAQPTDDFFIDWLNRVGFDRLRFLSKAADSGTPEQLYRKLRLCDLLGDALDGAKDEGPESYYVWIIEVLEQFHRAFSGTGEGKAISSRQVSWTQPATHLGWKQSPAARSIGTAEQMTVCPRHDTESLPGMAEEEQTLKAA